MVVWANSYSPAWFWAWDGQPNSHCHYHQGELSSVAPISLPYASRSKGQEQFSRFHALSVSPPTPTAGVGSTELPKCGATLPSAAAAEEQGQCSYNQLSQLPQAVNRERGLHCHCPYHHTGGEGPSQISHSRLLRTGSLVPPLQQG